RRIVRDSRVGTNVDDTTTTTGPPADQRMTGRGSAAAIPGPSDCHNFGCIPERGVENRGEQVRPTPARAHRSLSGGDPVSSFLRRRAARVKAEPRKSPAGG